MRIIATMKPQVFTRNADTGTRDDALTTRSLGGFFKPSSVDVEARTVEVVFASEAPYRRNTWVGAYDEVLSMGAENVRLERMRAGAPLCDNHFRHGPTLECVIGVVESVRTQGDQLVGTVRFSKREEAEAIFQEVIDGILRNFSVGYVVHKWNVAEAVNPGEVDVRTAIDWEPFELSITPVPADYTAQVRSQQNDLLTAKSEPTMEEDNVIPGAQPETQGDTRNANTSEPVAPVIENRSAAPVEAPTPTAPVVERAAERADVADPVAVLRQVRMAGLPTTFAEELLGRGLTAAQASDAIVARWEQNATPAGNAAGAAVSGPSEDETRGAGMVEAILHRSGTPGVELTDNGRRFRSMSMTRLAADYLESKGVNTRGLTDMQIAQRALRLRSAAGMHTTSDFKGILGDSINRSLRAAYNLQERTFTRWARRTTHSDLRTHTKNQLSGLIGGLDLIPEAGEYKAGTFNEAAESYKVQKFGKKVTYSLEMMINDDLSAFTRIPRALTAKAAQLQSDLVYGVLMTNAQMADGVNLFDTDHGNIATSGGAITETSLNAARTAMMKQKDLNGDFIIVRPRYLVVGPDRMLEAQKILTGITANTTGDVNVFAGSLELIVEPRLGNQWYVMADSGAIDTVEYAFLEGEGELTTEMEEGFDVDGTQVKVRMFFGTKAIDHRGMYYNAGA